MEIIRRTGCCGNRYTELTVYATVSSRKIIDLDCPIRSEESPCRFVDSEASYCRLYPDVPIDDTSRYPSQRS